MRRKDKEMADIGQIYGLLGNARVCRIAMIDGDQPYVVPMCYAHCDNTLLLHSALKGRKIEALKKNPNICFEVDTLTEIIAAESPCDWSVRYQSVIGFGKAVFIEDAAEKHEALDIIFKRYAGCQALMTDKAARATAVICIDIQSMTGKTSGI